MSIYRLLNHEAKIWWYHSQLRKQGRIAEARELERKSIRSSVKTLRLLLEQNGTLTECGDGTFITSQLRESPSSSYTSSMGGYRSGNETVKAAALLGIPVKRRKSTLGEGLDYVRSLQGGN